MAKKEAQKQRDYDYLFKLVLIGDSGVGKSCLLLRFAVRDIRGRILNGFDKSPMTFRYPCPNGII